jgi:hypothetical protein
MSFTKRLAVLCFSAGLALGTLSVPFLPPSAYAQSTSGNVTGTVTDATGAAVPGATVTATNIATDVAVTVKTDNSGGYTIGNLPAGKYNVSGTASGFSKFTLSDLTVDLNKTATANLKLSVATSSTQIEVTATAGAVLDQSTVQLTTTFSNEDLQSLPSATTGLGVLNVSLLSPGIASPGAVGAGTGPSVGGMRPRANNYMIEGVDNNNKSVTGPLIYIPNDAVGEFTLITNQFSPDFGHSTGGQFNTTVVSGTNSFHGRAYEYFQNKDLNAVNAIAGGKVPNPRYDNNRYGGQVGGPILKNKLFFFGNYERQTIGQSLQYFLCTPTPAGFTTLASVPGFSATNLGEYTKYMPVSANQVDASNDNGCFNSDSGPQFTTVYSGTDFNENIGVYGSGTAYQIPLGNYAIAAPNFSNFDAVTASMDWTISPKDNLRGRYLYNTQGTSDTAAAIPAFFQTIPYRWQLVAISEYHNFTPNLTNEARIGYNRYYNITPSGDYTFPGLTAFPTMYFYDQNFINMGPDGNAPQSTIQNLYEFVDNISWVKGNHTFKFGFDGRKFISPQQFTQRARGDYEWNFLTEYLHDLAPTAYGERSTGNNTYYGDQTAFYGYANDTYRMSPALTLNYGVRYEFTSVPVGERTQVQNSISSVPGLITFGVPQPQYWNFAPRVGIAFAPDPKTSIRAGFGMGYDVLYDNLGTLSFPPQLSQTNDVDGGGPNDPASGSPNFLANGGLSSVAAGFATPAEARAATAAYVPNQSLPYAETWSLGVQRVIGTNYTVEARYLGTRGIHLPAQIQLNKQPKVTSVYNIPTFDSVPSDAALAAVPYTLADINARSSFVPAFQANGFTSKITSFQPYSSSNYNGAAFSLTRRYTNGLSLNFAYTFSKTLDDATADVFSTTLTPRRPQSSQNVAADYGLSALSRKHRLTMAGTWDLPFYKHSGWMLRNVVGNWLIAPVYTYESPEPYTVLSGLDSNLNSDSPYTDRAIHNVHGVKGTGSDVTPVYDPSRAALCSSGTQCTANTVGYVPVNPDAEYYVAGKGTFANSARNSAYINPINNFDVTAQKGINLTERYRIEFQAQAFNVFNHAQYMPGTLNNINSPGYTTQINYQIPSNPNFNEPSKFFLANARTMQLALKFQF